MEGDGVKGEASSRNPDEPDLASMTLAEQLAWNATQLGKKPKRVIGDKPRDATPTREEAKAPPANPDEPPNIANMTLAE